MTLHGRLACNVLVCMLAALVLSVVAGVATAQDEGNQEQWAQEQWDKDPYDMAAIADALEDNVRIVRGLYPINSGAYQYCYELPEGATLGHYSSYATAVGQAPPAKADGAARSALAGVAADETASGTPAADEGPSEWIEYKTSAASVYKFSPSGLDEGEVWDARPAWLFMMRDARKRIQVCVSNKPGVTPPAMP